MNRQRLVHIMNIALTSLSLAVLLSGCVQAPVMPNDPYYAPVMQPQELPKPAKNGSLFSPNSSMSLFGDRKASRVGDIITVTLQERTTSSKSSKIDVLKDNDIGVSAGAGTDQIFGMNPSLGDLGLATNLSAQRQFTGEADADQSNQLTGNISVTVVDVYPNGTLVVRGEKWIQLNRGDEYIRISGLVRPDDVTPDNTVVSTKIANARIAYSGTGEFADSQRAGWLTQFFNHPLWPF